MRDRDGGFERDRLTRREALEEGGVVGEESAAAEEGVAFKVRYGVSTAWNMMKGKG